MTDSEVQTLYRRCVLYPSACMDAAFICLEKKREIQKTGGGRQRSEGVKLLNRIICRLRDVVFKGEDPKP